MDNLSFHITDITANSIRANATEIELSIHKTSSTISICITDNGSGMDPETIIRIRDPFYTTRTTRKVGLGLPFLIQNAEQTGGNVVITSTQGKGTTVIANFISSSIDCPAWGDLPGTVAMLIGGNPDIDIHFVYQSPDVSFDLSTVELKEILEDMPLSHPGVISYMKGMIAENIK